MHIDMRTHTQQWWVHVKGLILVMVQVFCFVFEKEMFIASEQLHAYANANITVLRYFTPLQCSLL